MAMIPTKHSLSGSIINPDIMTNPLQNRRETKKRSTFYSENVSSNHSRSSKSRISELLTKQTKKEKREEELRKYKQELIAQTMKDELDRQKRMVDDFNNDFRKSNLMEIEAKRKKIEEEQRIIREKEQAEKRKLERDNFIREKVFGKLKGLLLSIKYFYDGAEDFRERNKVNRKAFQENNKTIYNTMIGDKSSEVFKPLELLLKDFYSPGKKQFNIISNKFILNDYSLSIVKDKIIEANGAYIMVR